MGMVSWVVSAGWMNRFPATWLATSERIDVFFALVSKFFRAEAVAVDGLNIEMYASISGSGGGSLYADDNLSISSLPAKISNSEGLQARHLRRGTRRAGR